MEYVIAIDLGGTHLRGAVVDQAGQVITAMRMATMVEQGPEAVIERIAQCVAQLQPAVPADGTLLGVGVGAPGPLDPVSGIVFHAPNMGASWRNVPLRDSLTAKTGLPVAINNDANVAALAEWRFGLGQPFQHVVYITISTGIGCGAIVDGRLLLGRLGAAAELGHVLIDVSGSDGEQATSWENLASGTAFGAAAARAMPEHPDSRLHTLATPDTVRGAHVVQAAQAGDALAQRLVARQVRLIGIGLVNALHLFSPEIIIVGGGVIINNPWMLAQAREIAHQRVLADMYRAVPIEVTRLGDQVGVLGAAALIWYVR